MLTDSPTILKINLRGITMEALPYFRFFPAEWIMGDITLCSLSAQGLFVNILSFYWTKDCCITEAMLKHRFSQASTELEELLKHHIIKIKNDKKTVEINFLNQQYRELKGKRKKLQDAGRKGGKRSKPPLSQALSQAKATPKHIEEKREDKIRRDIKEEKREDKNILLDIKENAKKIISKLNRVTGKNFQDSSIIIENLLNGKTVEQHLHVIEVKQHDQFFQSHPNLMKPSTLFGEKFTDYITEKMEDFKQQAKNKPAMGDTPNLTPEEMEEYYKDDLDRSKP